MSIKANFDSINQLLHRMKSSYVVIALSEMWLSICNDPNHFKISNYIMYNASRNDNTGGRVVYTYHYYLSYHIKQSLQCSLIKQSSIAIQMLL